MLVSVTWRVVFQCLGPFLAFSLGVVEDVTRARTSGFEDEWKSEERLRKYMRSFRGV